MTNFTDRNVPAWMGYLRSLKLVTGMSAPDLFDQLPHTSWYRESLESLLSALTPSPSESLLDVGCGAGWFALWASKKTGKVIGLDNSSAMIERAERNRERGNYFNVSFVQADVYHLPFQDGQFDLATGTMLLSVLPDPAGAIAEIMRVVRPGGKIAVLTPSPSLIPAAATQFVREQGLVGIDRDTLIGWSIFGSRRHRFSESDLRNLFAVHAPEEITILPLLKGMAFAAIVQKI
jgi:SAM-dependent methyltransferase